MLENTKAVDAWADFWYLVVLICSSSCVTTGKKTLWISDKVTLTKIWDKNTPNLEKLLLILWHEMYGSMAYLLCLHVRGLSVFTWVLSPHFCFYTWLCFQIGGQHDVKSCCECALKWQHSTFITELMERLFPLFHLLQLDYLLTEHNTHI